MRVSSVLIHFVFCKELWKANNLVCAIKIYLQVIRAYDHKHQQYVALKLVRNEKRFHRQAEEEIRILVSLLSESPLLIIIKITIVC